MLDLVEAVDDLRIIQEDIGLMLQANTRNLYDGIFYGLLCFCFVLGLDALLPRPR